MKVIKFLKSSGPYNAGETAGFPDAKAAEYVNQGIAESTNIEPEEVVFSVPGAAADAGSDDAPAASGGKKSK